MKYFLLLITLLITAPIFSQIIYTESDGPSVGKIGYQTQIDLTQVDKSALEKSGGNIFWDFTKGADDTSSIEGTIILPLNVLPFSSDFKNSSFASTSFPESDSAFIFYKKTSNGLFIVGQYDNEIGNLIYTHPVIETPYPLTYGINFSDSASATVPTQIGDAKLSLLHNSNVDGWGTVKTKAGTFDCLRVRRNGILEALIGGFLSIFSATTNDYYWYSPKYAFPVATFTKGEFTTFEDTQNDTLASYLSRQSLVNTIENSPLTFQISPNPCSDFVNINYTGPFPKDLSVSIMDLEGKIVWTKNNMVKSEKIDVQSWPRGAYLIQVYAANGQWGIEKLILQ
jgi:hypothetical protein